MKPILDELAALRDTFRKWADDPIPTDRAIGIDQCADELDALIARLPPTEEKEKG